MFRVFVGAIAVATAVGLPYAAGADMRVTTGSTGLSISPLPLSQCQPGYYQNSYGTCVERPDQNPSNATAVCCDGSTSHSQHRSGTCSSHGGVCQWNGMGTDNRNDWSADRQRWL